MEGVWLGGWLPARLLGHTEGWRVRILMVWARLDLRILNVDVDRHGPVPHPSGLVVSNHLSYLDVVVLAAQMPCAFVAKREVRSWLFFGTMAASMGTVFVDRRTKKDLLRVGKVIEERVASGQIVVLFPEGTSSCGSKVLPFRSSLLAPFARSQVPVHYASIRYETDPCDPPATSVVAWSGNGAFPRHLLGLLALARIRARLVFGSGPLADPDRKRLAARLFEAVRQSFEPL